MALCIAVLGAESTGKTTLAAALASRLAADTGQRVAWVPELLRDWCAHTGRTPLVHEQAFILRAQHERIQQAADSHDVVVCDTTALMTAVYSRFVFGDRSLEARAVALHRHMTISLLTALDLPWVADGLQREGPHVQEPVDTMLRELLIRHRLAWALVSGQGPARLQAALDAVRPCLKLPPAGGRTGLFTGLHHADADAGAVTSTDASTNAPARPWICENCDDPACERLSGTNLRGKGGARDA